MAPLDEQAGQLHQGLGRPSGGSGFAGEGVELGAGLVEQVLAADEVAGLRGLVEQDAAQLVVDRLLQLVGGVAGGLSSPPGTRRARSK